ncbi:MAG: Mth938-like domain-containing protein [Pseudolabrys sp.]
MRLEKAASKKAAEEREQRSPRIASVAWGRIEVEGIGTFKDAKVFPGGAREWDWSETGTAHEPGIQPADVAELLDHGATKVVLSKGMHSCLHVCPQTLQLLKDRRVEVHLLQTEQAVELYNRLCGREQVAGLFHTTC